MKSIPIKLSFAEEVKSFVSIVNRYPYDMDLRAGRHVVDAKSILGIFSLDLGRPISLEVYTDSCEDLERDIAQFKI
ncbi:MAG: HPr family phosphocarrier protein [Clostridia bacterium]|nr:HPr family phosphocarrier protein [Clostridia bacterium]